MGAARWRFRAADASGVLRDGIVDAASEGDALDQLRRRALWPVDVTPLDSPVPSGVGTVTARRRESRRTALANAMRALSAMLDGGTALEEALALVARDAAHVGTRVQFGQLRERVLGGSRLSDAIRALDDPMPALIPALTAAGEQSGGLGSALGQVADDLEERAELEAQLRAALLYPAVLAVAALIGITLLLTVVVPRFARLLANSGQALPWSTRLVVAVSGFVGRWWWVLVPALVLTVLAVRQWAAQPAGRRQLDAARLRWPVIGALEETTMAARVMRTLALLLPAGVPLLAALDVARQGVTNTVLAERIDQAGVRLREGRSLAAAFDGSLPPLAVQLIAAGERGGDLGALAARGARHYEQLTRRALRTAVALVEPAIIILFGGLIAFVAVAMLQAIYGINARTL